MPRTQTILVVDDAPMELLVMTKILESPERRIVTASSGEEALAVVADINPALILLDVQMQGMSGIETADQLRRSSHTLHVPIIFVTASARDQEQMFEGYDAGAVDYLFKPIEPRLLLSKVEVFCQLHYQREIIASQLDEIRQKNQELVQHLEEISLLRGLVPICARCKKVRDDSGYWQTIEKYVSERSDAEFSHSVCPTCTEDLYPGFAKSTPAHGTKENP